jgi:hypothetical protein
VRVRLAGLNPPTASDPFFNAFDIASNGRCCNPDVVLNVRLLLPNSQKTQPPKSVTFSRLGQHDVP